MKRVHLLEERPPGLFDAPAARWTFTVAGTAALVAGVLQYIMTAQAPIVGDYPEGFWSILERARVDLWLTWSLLFGGALAAYAGLTRMRLRSWRVLSPAVLSLLVFAATVLARPPKVDSSFLIAAVVYPAPVIIAILWLALRGRKTMFR